MKRRLSVLEQGRAWERQYWKTRLRERRTGRPMRFRESSAARRTLALARQRRDLVALCAFMESYHGISVGRRAPAHSAIAAFKEAYRRPVK